jgi:putative endonuclease
VSHFHNVLEAIAWEKRVKRWRREKKEALIKREWEKLPELSKKDFKKYKLRKGLSH